MHQREAAPLPRDLHVLPAESGKRKASPTPSSVWGVTCGLGRLRAEQTPGVSCAVNKPACPADGIYCGTCGAQAAPQPSQPEFSGVWRKPVTPGHELFLGAACPLELLLLEALRLGPPSTCCPAQCSGQRGAWGHDLSFPLSFMN